MQYVYIRPTARVKADEALEEMRSTPIMQGLAVEVVTEEGDENPKDKPVLASLINRLHGGDIVFVYELSQLGRTLDVLLTNLEAIGETGANLISLAEAIDTYEPTSIFRLASVLLEARKEGERERLAEHMVIVRQKVEHPFGRPRIPQETLDEAVRLYEEGREPIAAILEETGISKMSLYRELRRRGVTRE